MSAKFWTEAIKEQSDRMPMPSKGQSEMTFAGAISEILAGKKLTRRSWGTDDCVFLHAGVLHLRKTDGSLHTLIVSEGDLSGDDWAVVREQ